MRAPAARALSASPELQAPATVDRTASVCMRQIVSSKRGFRRTSCSRSDDKKVDDGDPGSGAVLPWPFAVNAAGESRFFDTAAEAIRYVTA